MLDDLFYTEKYPKMSQPLWIVLDKKCEIIGNIFENPELLEVE